MSENATVAERALDALVVTGILTTEQLATARGNAEVSGRSAGEVLLEHGAFSEADLERVLESDLGVPSVDLTSYAPDDSALILVPASVARELDVLPLFEIEGTLTVAVGCARDVFGLDEVANRTGLEIEVVRASGSGVRDAIEQYYSDEYASRPVVAYTEFPDSVVWDQPAPGVGEFVPVPAEEGPAAEVAPEEPAVEEPALEGPAGEEAESEFEPLAEEAAPEPEFAEAEPLATQVPVEQPVSADYLLDQLLADSLPEAAAADESVAIVEPVAPDAIAAELAATAAPSAPAVDLDVLAVAEPGRVAVLVSDILELAVRRGASQVHLLPYKEEFFVVLRVAGRLEQIGHAPRSLQRALVDGFCGFAHVQPASAGAPVLARTGAEVAGRAVELTLSVVPTISGQRLVVAIGTESPAPPALESLGLSAAEAQALATLAERGRGLVFIAAPVGGGASTTYAALIARASSAGRTVYSVERSLGYEIHAAAQVVAGPGSPASVAAYLDAGLHQDTDVLALDYARDAEEFEFAIEAATSGKLAVVVVRAADAMSALRRVLDAGVEPEGLASTLTLVVGQRLVRTVCPTCAVLQSSALASSIPGADAATIAPVGAGCDACGRTGFGGVTALAEVIPVQEPLRAAIAEDAERDALRTIAEASGVRTLMMAGLGKVKDGLVSAEELDRVLRFSE